MEQINDAETQISQALPASKAEKMMDAKRVYEVMDPAELTPEKADERIRSWINEIPLITPYGKSYVARQIRTLAKGRSAVLTTRLGGDATIQQLFEELRGVLAPVMEGEEYRLLADFENENFLKTSPMSVQYPYKQRKRSLEAYFTDPGGDVTDEELAVACDLAFRFIEAGERRLVPLTNEEAMLRLPKDTQWGLPYCVRGVERDEELDSVLAEARGLGEEYVIAYRDYRYAYLKLAADMQEDYDHPGWHDPCLMGWRGDLGKPTEEDPIGTKQRVVWEYPHAVSILESKYYPVLTDYLRGKPGFAAWMDEAETMNRVVALLEQAVSIPNTTTWGFDASAFDQHLNERLIDNVSRNLVQRYFQKKYSGEIEQLSWFSKTCSMITPDGVMHGRSFNRPSGSGGTNLLDCLENLVMAIVVFRRLGASDEEILKLLKQMMGDDALYNVVVAWLENAEGEYAKAFGAKVNASKEVSGVGETIYLRRVYILAADVIGAASAARVVAKGKYYERSTPKYWSQYLDEIRWIAQLETLTKHPLWHEVVDLYVQRWAPLALGTSLEGGPRRLWDMVRPYLEGRTLDEVLDREDWARQYRGYEVEDPSGLKVVAYLYDRYVAGALPT